MSGMAKIELKYVQAFKDRHGRLRHYYRRPGCRRIALPGLPGSAEFMAAYAAASDSIAPPPQGAGAARTRPRSINALLVAYYTSDRFRALKPSTQTTYRGVLERFRSRHGDKPAALVQPPHLEAIFHAMATTPGAAATLRKRLRGVFRLAVRLGWRNDNPVTETEPPRGPDRGFIPWTEEQIAAFEKRWPSGTRERLALALLLYTGQRRSDVVRMGRQHRQGSRIKVKQMKTGHELLIPLHPKLQTEIEAAPIGMTFLLTQYGAPFSAAGFTAWFVARARDAGVIGRTPHGLRKAAGRRLAEAGCTAKQIAAVLGHTTLKQVEVYTRDADQGRLADEAMSRLRRTERRTATVKPV